MAQIGQVIQQQRKQQQQHLNALQISSTSLVGDEQKHRLETFCIKYNPSAQHELCADIDECYFGKHPTLGELNVQFGGKAASEIWLIPQLQNLVSFAGCKDKFSKEQYDDLSFVIANEYYYLKVSELMMFFHKFKLGDYGRFYGSADPLVITTALRKFVRGRADIIISHEQKEREKKRQEALKNERPITYQEYLATKNQT